MDVTVGTTTITTGYGFNPLDQLVEISRNGSSLANITYDERGNIESMKNTNGTYTAYEYNGGNQLVSVKNYYATGYQINSFVYTYDANGNRTSVDTPAGLINYQYDSLNN
jgi:YD repeat-containing protein